MSHSDLQSDTIHFLRFPLIVGVVFIHAHLSSDFVNITASDYPVFYVVNEFVSNILVRVSVPLFFFFSGFLFYYKTDFNGITYAKKVKSRIQSLLIPYLIWNIFLLALYYFVQKIPDINALFSGEKERIADFSVVDYLHAFGIGSDFPINYQFWFLRDLIILVVAAPLIFYFIRSTKGYGILLLGVLWLFEDRLPYNLFLLSSLFFFGSGAFFSISKTDFTQVFGKICYPVVLLYPLMAISDLFLLDQPYAVYLYKATVVVGGICLISIVSIWLKRGMKVNNTLSSASFFVFAMHEPGLKLIKKLAVLQFPHSELVLLLIYWGAPVLIILICLALYKILNTRFPACMKVVTGNRSGV